MEYQIINFFKKQIFGLSGVNILQNKHKYAIKKNKESNYKSMLYYFKKREKSCKFLIENSHKLYIQI